MKSTLKIRFDLITEILILEWKKKKKERKKSNCITVFTLYMIYDACSKEWGNA